MIYFIHDAVSQAIKIGKANDVGKRIHSLKNANPNPLALLGTLPGDTNEERLLHQQFKMFRRRGEWFNADPYLFRDVMSLLASNGRPSTVRDESARRNDCRSGLRGVEVSIIGIVDRFKIYSSQWGKGQQLLLDLYPSDQEEPDYAWLGPDTPENLRSLEIGLIHGDWIEKGWWVPMWPLGSQFKVPAQQCVLMTPWPVVCCEPQDGREFNEED